MRRIRIPLQDCALKMQGGLMSYLRDTTVITGMDCGLDC